MKKVLILILMAQLDVVLMAQEMRHIDLGLTVEWGECNLGANQPNDHGSYYAWGEVVSYGNMDTTNVNNYKYASSHYKNCYNYDTYKWYSGKDSILPSIPFYPYFSKYSNDDGRIFASPQHLGDELKVLEDSDDAANVALGGYWRMPTQVEMQELVDKCTWIKTRLNDVSGYLVVSKTNGNKIFLPVTGFYILDKVESDDCGYYWSKSLSTTDLTAETLMMDGTSDNISVIGTGRFMGNVIRPVWDPSKAVY